jgi:hypothetical protein
MVTASPRPKPVSRRAWLIVAALLAVAAGVGLALVVSGSL